jgi:hypothetical protein
MIRSNPSAFAPIQEYLRQKGLTPEAVKNEHRLEAASRLARHFRLHAWQVGTTMQTMAPEISGALPDRFAQFSNVPSVRRACVPHINPKRATGDQASSLAFRGHLLNAR